MAFDGLAPGTLYRAEAISPVVAIVNVFDFLGWPAQPQGLEHGVALRADSDSQPDAHTPHGLR